MATKSTIPPIWPPASQDKLVNIQQSRRIFGIITGIIAGIFGLEFLIALGSFFIAILCFNLFIWNRSKPPSDSEKTDSLISSLFDGIGTELASFILFWTILFNITWVY